MQVSVDLFQGPACSIAQGPSVSIISADGTEVQAGTEADPAPVTLRGLLSYELGWNIACDKSMPPGPLSVRIEFGDEASITMPVGDFGPSCVDGSTGELFMHVDAP